MKKKDPRRIFLRCTLYKADDGAYVVEPAKNQSSGLFGVIQRSNCMAIMPEGPGIAHRRLAHRLRAARRFRGNQFEEGACPTNIL